MNTRENVINELPSHFLFKLFKSFQLELCSFYIITKQTAVDWFQDHFRNLIIVFYSGGLTPPLSFEIKVRIPLFRNRSIHYFLACIYSMVFRNPSV